MYTTAYPLQCCTLHFFYAMCCCTDVVQDLKITQCSLHANLHRLIKALQDYIKKAFSYCTQYYHAVNCCVGFPSIMSREVMREQPENSLQLYMYVLLFYPLPRSDMLCIAH